MTVGGKTAGRTINYYYINDFDISSLSKCGQIWEYVRNIGTSVDASGPKDCT